MHTSREMIVRAFSAYARRNGKDRGSWALSSKCNEDAIREEHLKKRKGIIIDVITQMAALGNEETAQNSNCLDNLVDSHHIASPLG
jgi:hypothetical protein